MSHSTQPQAYPKPTSTQPNLHIRRYMHLIMDLFGFERYTASIRSGVSELKQQSREKGITLGPKNVSALEEIIFELISETEFLNGGWEELISETAFLNLVIFRIRGCIYL